MKKSWLYGLFMFSFPVALSAQDISIRAIQGEGNASPFANQVVTTRGAVTGVYSDGYFIRESSDPRSGLYIYDPGRNPKPILGDTLRLTGLITEYYEWTEMKSISLFEIISTGNPLPQPVVIQTGDIDENWESCFMKVINAACTQTTLGYGEWEVDDGSGTLVVNDMGVAFTPEAGQEYKLTGNLSYSFGAYKLEPRNRDDIEIMAAIYLTRQPYAAEIHKNSLLLEWETNTGSSSGVYYGTTENLEEDPVVVAGTEVMHSVMLQGFDPASIVYARCFSVLGEDTAFSELKVFSTESESTGEMIVSFNLTPTDMTFSDLPELFTASLHDTIVKYINLATTSLDLALYDFTNHAAAGAEYESGVAQAIYNAIARGVRVRLITDADVAGQAPAQTDPLLQRLDISHDGIMHDKFIIIDHESVLNSWIITGSANPNYNNLVLDFNNLLAIQDQSLARAYLLEFEEMWGGSQDTPNLLQSKSGDQKTDNTPHQFVIGGRQTELYFSPSDRTTGAIASVIGNSQTSIDFALMAFTENVLGNEIIAASQRGVDVKGIIDYIEYSGSEYNYLVNAGIEVLDYKNPDRSVWPDGSTLHHKFAVIDGNTPGAMLITGSHNWTASAESRNDENTLIIYDEQIAGLFLQESDRIRNWLLNPPVMPVLADDYFELTPGNELILNIMNNDAAEGELELSIVKQPERGTAAVNENYGITYTPFPDFTSSNDTLKYCVKEKSYPIFSDTAIVVLHMIPESVSDPFSIPDLSIYPNPASGTVTLKFSESAFYPVTIEWLNETGAPVFKHSYLQPGTEIMLDTGHLPAGFYFIRIKTSTMTHMEKIIIQ